MISNVGDLTSYKRWDIINTISKNNNYQTYLEIGTSDFLNFNKIKIDTKECIDPNPNPKYKYTYNMTSDEAFVIIKKENKKYDLIFIDGLHWSKQVTRDIQNSIDVLNSNGTIVLHDCNPPTALHACYPAPNPVNRPWNGDCFKSIIEFRVKNPFIYTAVVDTDWGVGIIQPFKTGNPILELPTDLIPNSNDNLVGGVLNVNNNPITWDFFVNNRKLLLNLISVDKFKNKFKLN